MSVVYARISCVTIRKEISRKVLCFIIFKLEVNEFSLCKIKNLYKCKYYIINK